MDATRETFIAPLKGAPRRGPFYQFTAIDDCTRIRMLRLYDGLGQKTAIPYERLRQKVGSSVSGGRRLRTPSPADPSL